MKKKVFLKGILSYSFSNIVIYFLSLVSVPLFIRTFGLTQYGIWTVILSLISYLSNSQFGLGTVTSVLIAKTEDPLQQKTIFNRSFDILILIATFFLILGSLFYFKPEFVESLIGNVPAEFAAEALEIFGILYFFFILRLPFISIPAAFVGHQDVQLERIYVAVLPQVLSFLALLSMQILKGDMVTMAMIIGIGNLIICISSAFHYYFKNKYFYSFKRHDFVPEPSKFQILKNGGLFFAAGISSMIIMNTDNIILSHLFGVDAVASYSITFKIFTIAFSIFFILNSALWPMFGRAFAKQEVEWIKSIFLDASINFPLIGGLIWVGGMAFMSDFIQLWIGNDKGYAGLGVVFALGGYGYVASVINFQTGLLSSVNVAKPFMWIGLTEAATNLILSVLLCQWVGPSGVAYGTLLAAILTSFILIPKAVKKYVHSDLEFPIKLFIKHFTFVLLPVLLLIMFLQKADISFWHGFIGKIILILIYALGSYYFVPERTVAILKSKISFFKKNHPPV